MANKEPTLLPCPFCKGAMMFRKALWPSDGNVDAIIHAEPVDCGMDEFSDLSIDESIIVRWNKRTPGQTSPSHIEDEERPDCTTDRERELYDALMGLSSAVTARQGWSKWVQGGVQIAPIVHKALRLEGSQVSSTEGKTP